MNKAARGARSHQAGLAAEDIAARAYQARGGAVMARRWRCPAGEIDLIVDDGEMIVFVEVKKSSDFAQAAARLSERQMRRIYTSAEGYLATSPKGLDGHARFDVALVDGQGAVEILENAFGQ